MLVVGLRGWMSAACGTMRRAGLRRCRAGGCGKKSHIRRKERSRPVGVTTGQGRKYLLAIGGEGKAPLSLEVSGTDVAADESSTCLDDIWAFQLPPESMTSASVKDATRHAIEMDMKQAKWAEVQHHYLDASGEEEKEIPWEPRVKGMGLKKGLAVARGTEVDGASVVIWGGVSEKGQVLDDGWLATVDR